MAKKSPSGSSKQVGRRKGRAWPFKEGDWFAVPLHPREAGFGVGRAARVSPTEGVVFGYFFALRFDRVPQSQELEQLKPEDSIWKVIFGPLGLLQGAWSVVGQTEGWCRENWPMPLLVNRDLGTNRPDRLTRYDDHDPFIKIESIYIHGSTPDEIMALYEDLPEDGLAGHVYVEQVLSDKIVEIEQRKRKEEGK